MDKNRRDDVELRIKGKTERGRELIRLIQELVKSSQDHNKPKITLQLLSAIISKLDECFKIEESHMQQTHEPDLSVHREQHRLLMENLTGYTQDIMKTHSRVSIEFCHYLAEWLNFHSENFDTKFSAF